MNTPRTFAVPVGGQYHLDGALVGVLRLIIGEQVGARIGVGAASGRVRQNLTIGEHLDVAGVGRFTLLDVRVGGPAERSKVLLAFDSGGDEGA